MAEGICQAHAFEDGNKRTAVLAVATFYTLNGYRFDAPDNELLHLIIDLTTHDVDAAKASELSALWAEPIVDDAEQRSPRVVTAWSRTCDHRPGRDVMTAPDEHPIWRSPGPMSTGHHDVARKDRVQILRSHQRLLASPRRPHVPSDRALAFGPPRCSMLLAVPARRRPKTPAATPPDPVAQFSAGLRASAEQERAAREQKRLAEEAARDAERRAAEHAAALVIAQRELTNAIEAVRSAKQAGRATVDADARWRAAKARVIELETGSPPVWASDRRIAPDPSDEDDDNEPASD